MKFQALQHFLDAGRPAGGVGRPDVDGIRRRQRVGTTNSNERLFVRQFREPRSILHIPPKQTSGSVAFRNRVDLETPLTSLASTRLFAVPASLLPARSFSDQGNSVGSFSDFRIFAYILRCVTIYWRGCRRASLRRGPQPSGPV